MDDLDLLTKDLLALGLKQLEKNEAGKFGYTQLDLKGYNVKSLEGDLKNYTLLRYIDMSHNNVESLDGLLPLTGLRAINFKSNAITELPDLSQHQQLQIVELDNNYIRSLINFKLLHVKALTLSRNTIGSLAPLEAVKGLPLLVLDLSFNEITATTGVECLGFLEILNLRGNKLTDLKGLDKMASLKQLDVRENQLSSLDSLRPLGSVKTLQFLLTTGNIGIHPEGTDDEALIAEVLMRVPQLVRWNDIVFLEEHRIAAAVLLQEREIEAAAKAAEAKAAAEAEAAAAEEAGEEE